MIRRIVVLLLLVGGALLLEPLRVPTEGVTAPRSLFLFGILLLAADTLGALAHQVGVPRLVGYLLAGLVLGPSVGHVVPVEVLTDMGMMKQLAVGLIGLLAGVELRLPDLRERWRALAGILVFQILVVLAVLIVAVMVARPYIPFTAGLGTGRAFLAALLLASMLIANSPMIVLAMLTETRAEGPLAKTTLGVVLVADVVVIVLFTIAVSIAEAAAGGEVSVPTAFLQLSGQLTLSIVAGMIVGGLLAAYMRWIHKERTLFAVVVVLTTAFAAEALHFELLLTLMVAGFLVENVAPVRAEPLVETLEGLAGPVYVVFFALAGAELALREFLALWPIVLGLVVLRAGAVWAGTWYGARVGDAEPVVRRYAWTGLVPQAGVAVGLASIVADRFPGVGPGIETVALGVIAVNSTLGPILFRYGLGGAGEDASAGVREHP